MGRFNFALITDAHCAEQASWKADPLGTHLDRFHRCIETINAMEEPPDFIMLLGDIHLWAIDDFQTNIPIHIIAGNHECGERKAEMRARFPEDFNLNGDPSDYYHFIHKGVRFIALCNAGQGGDHIGHLCSEDINPRGQSTWLHAQAHEAEDTKIIFAHTPPAIDGVQGPCDMGLNDSLFFTNLLKETNITAAFFGHKHLPRCEFVVGNTSCHTLSSCAWNHHDSPLSFCIATVDNGSVDIKEIVMS